MTLGKYAVIGRDVEINTHSQEGVLIGKRTSIGAYTIISATNQLSKMGKGVSIGDDSGIGQFSFIGASGGVSIGHKVIMGQYVSFHASNHIFDNPEKAIKDQGTIARGIVIEDDVWVGAKVTFLDGTIVRKHSVVAAGAVVSGDFPAGVIIGGVPARVLKPLPTKTID